MGALYPDVTELLRQADTTQALTCRVRNDALPQAVSVYDLVKAGKMKKVRAKKSVSLWTQDLILLQPQLICPC